MHSTLQQLIELGLLTDCQKESVSSSSIIKYLSSDSKKPDSLRVSYQCHPSPALQLCNYVVPADAASRPFAYHRQTAQLVLVPLDWDSALDLVAHADSQMLLVR
jgi:hypothetical protein